MMTNFRLPLCLALAFATPSVAEERRVYLMGEDDTRIEIATLNLSPDGTYSVAMRDEAFQDHFLSMRPFKCIEGPQKHWCHVPYPYEIRRDLNDDLTDLAYDFLFLWKGAGEYGINMWNGVYYRLEGTGATYEGRLYEFDMGRLAVPPAPGELRPIREKHLTLGDPSTHLFPRLMIE